MANIKGLKKKIKSTKGTLKITSAMKLVAASKLNRAQMAIQNSRPYSRELEESIKIMAALVENYEHNFLKTNEETKNALLLVISSDRGLCGGYNSQLYKSVRDFLKNHPEENIKVCFVGRKVKELLEDECNAGETFTFQKGGMNFQEVVKISQKMSNMFEAGEVGKIYVAYNTFKSAISFSPTIKQVLPMVLKQEEALELKKKFPFDFKYEPSATKVLDSLIPEAYVNEVYGCFLNAVAAEHGARMAAMDNASGNCKEAIRSLTLVMNKKRQAKITTELIEVVSGAESLSNG